MQYNWIQKCLNSLLDSLVKIEIIVIDNASTDETVNFIQKKYSQVDLIVSKENLGFGKANNIGIKYAIDNGADYVFLLNQDAWVEPNTIEKLLEVHKIHPKYGILSPIHLNGTYDRIDENYFHYSSRDHYENLWYDCFLSKMKEVYSTERVNAAAWFMSRECIDRVGLFNPMFKHYGEDDNYCDRAKYHGFKIGIVPSVTICHDRDYERSVTSDFYSNKLEHLKNSCLMVSLLDPNNKNFMDLYNLQSKLYIKNIIKYAYRFKIKPFIEETKKIHKWLVMKKKIIINRQRETINNAFSELE